jgi:hypothetical protein
MEEQIFENAGIVGVFGYLVVRDGGKLVQRFWGRGDRLAKLEQQVKDIDGKVDLLLERAVRK